jgi:hypothetical protein
MPPLWDIGAGGLGQDALVATRAVNEMTPTCRPHRGAVRPHDLSPTAMSERSPEQDQ